MIKKFEVSRNKPFKYLIEVFNSDTNKLKYIIQCYDNLKDALTAYEK